eukprot:CAMPEP_0170169008 /NCGR_PEP_ID=MMETSP0040_2-20121228/1935_1 /TAXON_ID=641309 /ORGANISM="Lotharella oceanica, Strain CCMP622" /LENGTH=145 /DNA_ID=CAMNT_0010407485 /DNA_START=1177 /DNA_END=1614 /DNA_ORIENTATION=-
MVSTDCVESRTVGYSVVRNGLGITPCTPAYLLARGNEPHVIRGLKYDAIRVVIMVPLGLDKQSFQLCEGGGRTHVYHVTVGVPRHAHTHGHGIHRALQDYHVDLRVRCDTVRPHSTLILREHLPAKHQLLSVKGYTAQGPFQVPF